MGTLRLKRGTKTALQTNPGYTPAEGELVYTTDSKEVFVGDGSTTGGIPVSVSTQNLEDLGNVQALAAQKDQILVYNGSNWAATDNPQLDVRGNIYGDDSTLLVDAINGKIVGPIETTSITSSGSIVGNLVGDVTGTVTGNVVGDTTGTHYGNVVGSIVGDVTGSVFGDDSTKIVDGVDNSITATTATITTADISNELTATTVRTNAIQNDLGVNSGILDINMSSVLNTQPRIELKSDGTAGSGLWIMTVDSTRTLAGTDNIGRILFRSVDAGGTETPAVMIARKDELIIAVGAKNTAETTSFDTATGNVGIGVDINASAKLNVGGAVMFGSLTTAERDALTAANGMVIYNSSTNKFQGYENGAWVNLV